VHVRGERGLGLRARAFIRADANSDSLIDIGDPIWTVNHLFLGGFPPKCMDAADSNDDSDLNISDVVYTLNYLFLAGPRPPAAVLPALRGRDDGRRRPRLRPLSALRVSGVEPGKRRH
jgi:hypothetical protein